MNRILVWCGRGTNFASLILLSSVLFVCMQHCMCTLNVHACTLHMSWSIDWSYYYTFTEGKQIIFMEMKLSNHYLCKIFPTFYVGCSIHKWPIFPFMLSIYYTNMILFSYFIFTKILKSCRIFLMNVTKTCFQNNILNRFT